MRILALDVGDKYVGVAVSDPLCITAQAVKTFKRTNKKADIGEINALVKEYSPQKLIIGLPKNMNGTIGPQAEKVLEFGNLIKRHVDIEIEYWDERLTTISADRAMLEGDLSRRKETNCR